MLALTTSVFAQGVEPPGLQRVADPDSGWFILTSRATNLMDSLWRAERFTREIRMVEFTELHRRTMRLYQRALDLYLEELPRIQTSKEVWTYWWNDFDRQQERFWQRWHREFGGFFEQHLEALQEDSYFHRLEKTIPLTNTPAIFLAHESGDVDIRGIPQPVAHLVAEIRVMAASQDDAEQYARGYVFEVTPENSITRVTTRRPSSRPVTVQEALVSLQLEIPQECPLQVDNALGDVRVQGLKKGLKVRTSYGSVQIHSCAGDLDLSNKLGGVFVREGDGDLFVETTFRPIVVTNIRGNVFASNKFGSISLTGISGAVQVENSDGPVQIDDVQGAVTVDNHLGDIAVQAVGGDLRIQNAGSPVRITDILGETHIENRAGEIRAERLGGNVIIRSREGDVILVLDEIRQNIYRLDTSFGIVRVNLPPRPSALISAETLYGTIDSDFPLEIKRSGSTQRAQGKLGQGKADIQLDAKNANIYLISSRR